jgi:hypothetical protein
MSYAQLIDGVVVEAHFRETTTSAATYTWSLGHHENLTQDRLSQD